MKAHLSIETAAFWHGSPYAIPSFTQYIGDIAFLTPSHSVAVQYAKNPMMAAQRAPAGAKKSPSVYKVDVNPGAILDTRSQRHAIIYNVLRKESLQREDPDEHLRRLEPGRLPGFGVVRQLREPLMRRGYGAMWVDEGGQGASLAVFNPQHAIRIIDSGSV